MSTVILPPVPPSPKDDAMQLHRAFKGFGCDTNAVINILAHRDAAQRAYLQQEYRSMYYEDLLKRLSSELSGKLENAVLLWMHDPAGRDAVILRQSLTVTKVLEAATEVICSRTPAQLQYLRQIYHAKFGIFLDHDIERNTSGDHKKLLLAYLNTPRHEGPETNTGMADNDVVLLYRAETVNPLRSLPSQPSSHRDCNPAPHLPPYRPSTSVPTYSLGGVPHGMPSHPAPSNALASSSLSSQRLPSPIPAISQFCPHRGHGYESTGGFPTRNVSATDMRMNANSQSSINLPNTLPHMSDSTSLNHSQFNKSSSVPANSPNSNQRLPPHNTLSTVTSIFNSPPPSSSIEYARKMGEATQSAETTTHDLLSQNRPPLQSAHNRVCITTSNQPSPCQTQSHDVPPSTTAFLRHLLRLHRETFFRCKTRLPASLHDNRVTTPWTSLSQQYAHYRPKIPCHDVVVRLPPVLRSLHPINTNCH
ncbi:hypothetical protein RYX36_020410 [Vicia faba]